MPTVSHVSEASSPEVRCLALINSLPEMIFEIDNQMNIVFANAKATQITGYSEEEFQNGMKISQLIAPEDIPRGKNNIEKVFSGESTKNNEYTFIKKDGSRYNVSVSAVPITQEGKVVGARGIITDITQIKQTQKELKLFSLALQTSIDGIVIKDQQNNITYVNDSILKMYKSNDKNDIIGKKALELVHETDRARAIQDHHTHQNQDEGWTSQYLAKLKDNTTLPVEITSSKIKDENQTIIGYISIVRDISHRIKNEEKLKEANQKIELANEKLLVVGGLVRHDIANKLTTIDGNIYLAKLTGKNNTLIPEIENASAQIRRILTFSKDYEMLGTEQATYLNVGEIFNQTLSLFSDLKNIQAINQANNLNVLADSLLKELFYNLIDNTRKYAQKATHIKLTYSLNENQDLKLIYEDNGIGIPHEQKPKLFTKGFGRGTGLGLYLIKRTLQVYGWQIQETGIPGEGARFEITIPKNNANEEKANYQIPPPT